MGVRPVRNSTPRIYSKVNTPYFSPQPTIVDLGHGERTVVVINPHQWCGSQPGRKRM